MRIKRDMDDIEEPTAEELAEIEELSRQGLIPDIADASEEDKAKTRDIILNGTIVIPDNVREQLKKLGITEDEVIAGLLGAVNGKQ
jgi:hypothetical protein